MAAASEAKIKELIQGVGFQNTKAKYLKQAAATIIEVRLFIRSKPTPVCVTQIRHRATMPAATHHCTRDVYFGQIAGATHHCICDTSAINRLWQEHGGEVPNTLDGLLALRGVGPKMALLGTRPHSHSHRLCSLLHACLSAAVWCRGVIVWQ